MICGKKLTSYLVNRGYNPQHVTNIFETVKKMDRNSLLQEENKPPSDPQSILVTTWHPLLNKIPSILHRNYPILSNDQRLSKIFKSKPMVAFRRKKTIGNTLIRNDVKPRSAASKYEEKCKCKICRLLNRNEEKITNPATQLSIPAVRNVSCKSAGVVYVATCKIHRKIYVGHTGNTLSKRFSDHRYDMKKRPENNELAEHLHVNHDFDRDLMIQVAHVGIDSMGHRKYLEDKVMCKLLSKPPLGLNVDSGHYVREMYASWSSFAKQ